MALIELTLAGYIYIIGLILLFGPSLVTYLRLKEEKRFARQAHGENLANLRNWRNR